MTTGDHVKAAIAITTSAVGNALCWAYQTDLGVLAAQMTLLSTAVGGSIYLVGQGVIRVYKLHLDTKLAAEVERETKLGPSISRKLEEVVEKLTAAEKDRMDLAQKLEVSERKRDEYEEENHRLLKRLARQQDTAKDSMSKIERAVATVEKKVISGPRVLIVDDEPTGAGLLCHSLTKNGYECETVTTIAGARVKTLENFRFVLLDVYLADGSGLDFLREIKHKHTNTLVFILTGHPGEHVIKDADAAYADFIMPKPIDFQLLIAKMEELITKAPRPHASEVDAIRSSGDSLPTMPVYNQRDQS